MATIESRTVIYNQCEIPSFASEDEERAFWATHEASDELAEVAEPIPDGELPAPRPRNRPTSIRLESDTIARLRVVAARKGIPYQALIKDFIAERLYEEEKRLNILDPATTRFAG